MAEGPWLSLEHDRLCAGLIAEITEEIGKLSKTPPDASELERAQNSHEAGFLRGLESVLQRAIQLASYDVQANDPAYLAKDIARFRAVTAAQVKDAAAKTGSSRT